MEVQVLIERRDKLQDDIRDTVTNLIKEFEVETGVDVKTISINNSDIKVIHVPAQYDELASVMGDSQPYQEVSFVTRIGLDV